MIYTTLRGALCDFFTHNAPLVSAGGYYSSEDVFTALPYAKGRRYFDAVALPYTVKYKQEGDSQASMESFRNQMVRRLRFSHILKPLRELSR